MTRRSALIVGCGDLGTEAGLRLRDLGWRVLGVRRSPDHLPTTIEGRAGDLVHDRPKDWARLARTLPDHLDALIFAPAADERTEPAYRAVYRDGPLRVLDALEAVGRRPGRVLAVSSTAVHGEDDGSDVDEDTPVAPTTPTGRALADAEDALHAYRPDAIVLRLAGIYGPGRTRLIDQVRRGEAMLPDEPALTNRIHRDDAAAAIVHLLTRVADPEGLYLGVDHAPSDRGEILRFLAAELGAPVPAHGSTQRHRGGNKRLHNDRLVATGFRFAYPTYREGYRAVLADHGVRHR